ncbi:hypothetical protein X875_15300 [Mannheimia varigena USDA-ARS-USMARC-1388]|nr:hypothetical protein X875_15300 [Mannheimia varigena USDA-ARS-USMARC-1388]
MEIKSYFFDTNRKNKFIDVQSGQISSKICKKQAKVDRLLIREKSGKRKFFLSILPL